MQTVDVTCCFDLHHHQRQTNNNNNNFDRFVSFGPTLTIDDRNICVEYKWNISFQIPYHSPTANVHVHGRWHFPLSSGVLQMGTKCPQTMTFLRSTILWEDINDAATAATATTTTTTTTQYHYYYYFVLVCWFLPSDNY